MNESPKEIKRVSYCEGQQLRVDDFRDEQSYLLEMRWLHNRSLHTWGIGKGLEVNQVDARQVKINLGIAIDNYGRELVLSKEITIDVVTIAPPSTSEKFYLTISYSTEKSNSGQTNKCGSRVIETPLLEVLDSTSVSKITDGTKILLARLTIEDCKIADIATKNLTELDQSDLPRSRYVDMESVRKSGDIMTGPLTIKAPFKPATSLSDEIHALTIQGTVDSAALEITADKNISVDEKYKNNVGDSWIYFQTIEKNTTVKSRKAGIGWRDEKGYFAVFTYDEMDKIFKDRLVIKPDGKVGFGTTDPIDPKEPKNPKEALQIGDRWTFRDGSDKIIGYNYYYGEYGEENITDRRIHIGEAAAIRFSNAGSIILQTAGTDSANSKIVWNNALAVDKNGSIGIGTKTPSEKLEVLGNIKFGPSSNFFALGASKNLKVIIGRVNLNGSKAYGEGFTSSKIATGEYEVVFQNGYKFKANPIILVTAGSGDSVTNTKSISKEKFFVWSYDVPQSGQAGEKEDTPFDFIAIGERQ